jgi:NIMA (never in mitosis gene a)-related kinase
LIIRHIKLLGEGSFGKAFLVQAETSKEMAVIKQMDLSKMSEAERRDTLIEAKILERLNHPNIIRFNEVYKTKKGKLCIVMEYADGGDLAQKISEKRGKEFLKENYILDIFVQICLGVKHIHDRKVLHRDLKSQNVFLTKSNIVKLGDFGIAKMLTCTNQMVKTMVGTP